MHVSQLVQQKLNELGLEQRDLFRAEQLSVILELDWGSKMGNDWIKQVAAETMAKVKTEELNKEPMVENSRTFQAYWSTFSSELLTRLTKGLDEFNQAVDAERGIIYEVSGDQIVMRTKLLPTSEAVISLSRDGHSVHCRYDIRSMRNSWADQKWFDVRLTDTGLALAERGGPGISNHDTEKRLLGPFLKGKA